MKLFGSLESLVHFIYLSITSNLMKSHSMPTTEIQRDQPPKEGNKANT